MKLKKQEPEKKHQEVKKYRCTNCSSITDKNGWCPKCGATQTREIKDDDKV